MPTACPDDVSHLLIRAANWVGDAVMSLPALRAVRGRFPKSRIAIQARPWVADIYAREPFDEVILYDAARGARDWMGKWRAASDLRRRRFDCALLLPNSFDAALVVFLAGIPRRVGYARDGRGLLLTAGVAPPRKGEIPRHESFYYLELLRRAGWLERLPAEQPVIRLEGANAAREAGLERFTSSGMGARVIGVSPGAAYGTAKQWMPERFAEAASTVAERLDARVAIFGSAGEHALCETVAERIGSRARNFAGRTSLSEFIELAAACLAFLTNDSGSMHIASALGVPTVAVFGATDHIATGPTGPLARVIREPVDCAPCLLRECPIDHRCMTRVNAGQVAEAALNLLK
jgi:heptosyltransferase-2